MITVPIRVMVESREALHLNQEPVVVVSRAHNQSHVGVDTGRIYPLEAGYMCKC